MRAIWLHRQLIAVNHGVETVVYLLYTLFIAIHLDLNKFYLVNQDILLNDSNQTL